MSSAPTIESALAAFAALLPCGNGSFAGCLQRGPDAQVLLFAGSHLQTLSVHLASGCVDEHVLKTLACLSPNQLAFFAPLLERFFTSSSNASRRGAEFETNAAKKARADREEANKSSVNAAVVVLGKLRGLSLKIPEAPDPSFWRRRLTR